MNFSFSREQQDFRRDVRAFIAENLPSEVRERLRAGHAPLPAQTIAWHRKLNEQGWAAPHWPREYGGLDLGMAERLILAEELYRAPAPMPLVFNVSMLGPVLLRFGTPEQKAHFLPRLANLDLWFCQGFSEPGAGSDLTSLRTAARREGDHYVVDGQKIWTTMAHVADWMFCLVRTADAPRKQDGISFLLIDMKAPGVTVRPIISIDGAHHLNEVFFDSVRVPVENRVGAENEGWACARYLLGNERTGIAGVPWCRERLDRTLELAATLVQHGQPLLANPLLRAEIATLRAEMRALEVSNWRFIVGDPDGDDGARASVLKLQGSALQQRIAALMQRLSGGAALQAWPDADNAPSDQAQWAAGIAPRYFYSRAASIYGGANEIQRDIVARICLG